MIITLFSSLLFIFFSQCLYVPRALLPLPRPLGVGMESVTKYFENILLLSEFKEILFLNLVLIIIVVKLGVLYCSKTHFVTFDINLNLLRKNDCNLIGHRYMDFDLLVLHSLIFLYFLLFNPDMILLIQCDKPYNFGSRQLHMVSRCNLFVHVLISNSILFTAKNSLCP